MAKKVIANGKEFTFNDNVTEQQIGEAIDAYFKGNVKKKEDTQKSVSPKNPIMEQQPSQSKSNGIASAFGVPSSVVSNIQKAKKEAEGNLESVDLQGVSKELQTQYKQSPFIPEYIKKSISDEDVKSIINKKVGLEASLDDSGNNTQKLSNEVIFGLDKKVRDAKLKEIGIADLDAINNDGLVFGGADYQQSKTGKVADLVSKIKQGKNIGNDLPYLQQNAPKIWQQLKEEASATQTLNEENPLQGILTHFDQISTAKKQIAAQKNSVDALKTAQSYGFDLNRYNDISYLNELNKNAEESIKSQLDELDKKYPKVLTNPYKGNYGSSYDTYTPKFTRDERYEEEKQNILDANNFFKQKVARASASIFSEKNPNATPEQIGEFYMSIADNDKYTNFKNSNSTHQKTKGEMAKIGYEIMYGSTDAKKVKEAKYEESRFNDKYPEFKDEEIAHRLGAELYKKQYELDIPVAGFPGGIKTGLSILTPRPTIQELDAIVNSQFNEEDKKAYYNSFRQKELRNIFGTYIPQSGLLNKAGEGFVGAAESSVKSIQDLLGVRGREEQAYDALDGTPVGRQDVGGYEVGKQRLSELSSKKKLTIPEIKEKKSLEKFVGIKSGFDDVVDNIANTTGQVAYMALGSKGFGALGKTAEGAATLQKIGGATLSYAQSYDDARVSLYQLDPNASEEKASIYANIIALANAGSEHIFSDAKVIDAFGQEVKPLALRIVNGLSEKELKNMTKAELAGHIKKFMMTDGKNFAKNFIKNTGQEVTEEEGTQLITSAADAVVAPNKWNAKDEFDKLISTATQTAIGGSLVAGIGAYGETKQNRISTSLINRVGYDEDLANDVKDVIRAMRKDGSLDNSEANRRMAVVNTMQNIHQTTLKTANEIRPLSKVENEKIAMITLQERIAKDKIKSGNYDDVKNILEEQIQKLQEDRNKIIKEEVVVDENHNLLTAEEWNKREDESKLKETQNVKNDTKTPNTQTPNSESTAVDGQDQQQATETTTNENDNSVEVKPTEINGVIFTPSINEVLGTPQIEMKDGENKVGQLRTYTSEKEPDVLITNSIEVAKSQQGKGIAKQAYVELSKQNPDKTIRSSGQLTEGSIGVWNSLVKDGIATEVKDGVYEIQPYSQRQEKLSEKEKSVQNTTSENNPALKDVESTAIALGNINLENKIPFSLNYDSTNPKEVAEAYHKAVKNNSDDKLVKSVESLLKEQPTESKKESNVDNNAKEKIALEEQYSKANTELKKLQQNRNELKALLGNSKTTKGIEKLSAIESKIAEKQKEVDTIKKSLENISSPSKTTDNGKIEKANAETERQQRQVLTAESSNEGVQVTPSETTTKEVKSLIDKRVEYNGEIGNIKQDEGGKLTFENDKKIIELNGTEIAKEFIPETIKFDNGNVSIGKNVYQLVSINENNDNEVVSVSLKDSNGKNITIRDIDTALAIEKAKLQSENESAELQLTESEENDFVKVELQNEWGGLAWGIIESMPNEVADTFGALESGIVSLAPNELKQMVVNSFDWADSAKEKIKNSKSPEEEKKQAIKFLDKFQKELNKYYDTITKQQSKSSNDTIKQDGSKQSSEKNSTSEEKKTTEVKQENLKTNNNETDTTTKTAESTSPNKKDGEGELSKNGKSSSEKEYKPKTASQLIRQASSMELVGDLVGQVKQFMIGVKYKQRVLQELLGSRGKANSKQAMAARGTKRFIGKSIAEEVKARGAFMNSKKGEADKKYESVDKIVHDIWENLGREDNETEIKYIVTQVILDFTSPSAIAQDIIDNHNLSNEDIDANEEYRKYLISQLPEGVDENGNFTDEYEEALDMIFSMTSDQIEQLYNDQESFLNSDEFKKIHDSNVQLSSAKNSPLESARKEFVSAKNAYNKKVKELYDNAVSDSEDLFGNRKSAENNLFGDALEKADETKIQKALEPYKKRLENAKLALEKANKNAESQGTLFNADKTDKPKITQKAFDKLISILKKSFPKVATIISDPKEMKAILEKLGHDSVQAMAKTYNDFNYNLIAVHNISLRGLLNSDRLGGIAMPSLAILKANQGFDSYGEISLVANGNFIDPKKNKQSNVFQSDVYSARYPSVTYIIKKYFKADELGIESSSAVHSVNNDIESSGIDGFESNTYVKQKYLISKGVEIPFVYETKKISEEQLNKFKELGLDKLSHWQLQESKEFNDLIADELNSKYSNDKSVNFVDENGKVNRNLITNYAYSYIEDSKVRIDKYATSLKVDELINKDKEAYSQYAKKEYEKLEVEEKIFKGYTYAGKRQYIAYNLPNIIKEMKKAGIRNGEKFGYGAGSVRASVSTQFKSVEQLKNNADKLTSSEEFDKVKDEITNELIQILDSLKEYYKFESNGFGYFDNANEELAILSRKGSSESFNNIPSEKLKELNTFLAKLNNAPTEYFEAKINRAVQINEFDTAVVPDNLPKEAIKILESSGLNIVTYKANNKQDRKQKTEQVTKDRNLQFLKTKKGDVYGFSFTDENGKDVVVLDKELMNIETPIHEFSHVWEKYMPSQWKNGIELFKNTTGFKKALAEIQTNEAYQSLSKEQQISEAMNTLIGRMGVGYFEKGPKLSAFQNWVKNIFKKLGDKLGIRNLTPDDKFEMFANKVLGDIMGGKEIVDRRNLVNSKKDLSLQNATGNTTNKRLLETEEQGRDSSGEINALATTFLSRLHQRIESIYGKDSKEVFSIADAEETYLEDFAKATDIWVDDADTKFGEFFDKGQEQSVYIDSKSKNVTKVTKLNDGSLSINWLEFLDRIALHNTYFPSTAYTLKGFGRTSNGNFIAIIEQPYIVPNPTTEERIKEYMEGRGYEPLSKYDDSIIGTVEEKRSFINKKLGIIIEDLHLKNVFEDEQGNMFVIDPVISLDTEDRGYGGTRKPNESEQPQFQVRQSNEPITPKEIEDAKIALDTAIENHKDSDDALTEFKVFDAFETLAQVDPSEAKNKANEVTKVIPDYTDDIKNAISNNASTTSAKQNTDEREIDAIRRLVSEKVDIEQYPGLVDDLVYAKQMTATTTGNAQEREVDGKYVKLSLENMKELATQKALQLEATIGKNWIEKTLDFFEKEPFSGSLAQSTGILNIMSTDIMQKINNSTDIIEIDNLKSIQHRIDLVINDKLRDAALSLNYRRLFEAYAKGESVTAELQKAILDTKSRSTIDAVTKAMSERVSDEVLNNINEAPVAPAQVAPETKKTSSKKQTNDSVKQQIKNKAINSLSKLKGSWQDAIQNAIQEMKKHKC